MEYGSACKLKKYSVAFIAFIAVYAIVALFLYLTPVKEVAT